MELEIKKELSFNEASSWGIYSCVPIDYTREIKLHKIYNNFVIRGNTRKLTEGNRYTVSFEGDHTDKNYGTYYQIINVEPEKLDTVEAQDKFLQAIISENQFESLRSAYPEGKLVDMIANNEIDTSKTKGIKEKTINKIKEKIEENEGLSVLIANTKGLDLTPNALSKIIKHYKDSKTAIEKIKNDIYDLCNIPSFGFATVDKIALGRGDNPTGEKRINAAIHYSLKQEMSNGHSWTSKNTLTERAFKLLEIPEEYIGEHINKLKDSSIYYFSEGNRIALRYVIEQEESIYDNLLRIQQTYVNKPDKKLLESRLSSIEAKQGFSFTSEQKEAIIEGSQHGVMVINGKGGTGKSSIVNGLIESLGTDNYITAALSGKASFVLTQKGVNASTIHRMMGYNPEGFTRFFHNKFEPLPYDLIVLDEVSMIDVSLFNDVIQAVSDGAKLIIVGDSGQLPAISYGDVLRDLIETKGFPTYELTQVHRQAAKSGILSLANSVRDGNQIMPYNASGREVYGELQDQTVISYSDKSDIPNDIVNIAKQYATTKIESSEDLLDLQILVSNRERGDLSVKALNTELQKVFNTLSKPHISSYDYHYREGDKVIQNGNSYDIRYYTSLEQYFKEKVKERQLEDDYNYDKTTDLYNGTLGIIKDLYIKGDEKIILVEFEGTDGVIALDTDGMKSIDMAYALTVHKSQGSGFKHVIFALDFGAFSLLSKQLVYTAITRAIEKGVILCENNAMFKAISNDASKSRRTFLGDIIRGNKS